MARHVRLCKVHDQIGPGRPRKYSGHARKWQDMHEDVQDILVNQVDMLVNGRT